MTRGMQRLAFYATGIALTLSFGLINSGAAQAAPEPLSGITAPDLQADADAFVDATIRLAPSIARADDGTLELETTAADAGVNSDTFHQILASLDALNESVLRGELLTTEQLQITPANPSVLHNGVIYYWWGMEVHFTKATLDQIIGAMNAGAGVATIIAIVTAALGGGVAGIAPGVVAALFTIGSGVLQACANSNGVIVSRPYVGPVWCGGH